MMKVQIKSLGKILPGGPPASAGALAASVVLISVEVMNLSKDEKKRSERTNFDDEFFGSTELQRKI